MTVHSAALEGVRSRSAGWSALLGLLAPAGRVLFSTIFIAAGFTRLDIWYELDSSISRCIAFTDQPLSTKRRAR